MPAQIQMTGALDPRSGWSAPGDHCPVARMLDTIGTKSAFLVMREAFYGATRYEEFVERTGMSEPVVAARLRELSGLGLLEKFPYREPGQRTRYGYQLTGKGEELLPVLVAMYRWSNRWLFPDGPESDFSHSGCGAAVHAELRCEAGHAVELGEMELSLTGRRGRPASR